MKKIMNARWLCLFTRITSVLPLLPFSATAAEIPYSCTTATPGMAIKLPGVINMNKDMSPGTVVYETQLPAIKYTCFLSTPASPSLVPGFDYMTKILKILKDNGLKMVVDTGSGSWSPESQLDKFPLGDKKTGEITGTLSGSFKLVLNESISKPVKVLIPTVSDFFRIIPGYIGESYPYIKSGLSANTWLYFVPKCVGKTSVPAEVNLGRVITGGKGSLPSPRNFYIKPSFNQDCKGFQDINSWDKFLLTLEIQFSAAGDGSLSADGNGIILKNADGQENGLKLVIKEAGSTPVKFGAWSQISPAISVVNSPLNLHYTASLEPATPGGVTSAVTGKFSQPVTVKVRYQ